MSDYSTHHQIIKDTPLDELIKGDCGDSLSGLAEKLCNAFLAMSAEQIITACHHDYRLSDEVRQAARKLADLIDEQAHSRARQDREYDCEEAAWEGGWQRAGDQIAMERTARQ